MYAGDEVRRERVVWREVIPQPSRRICFFSEGLAIFRESCVCDTKCQMGIRVVVVWLCK